MKTLKKFSLIAYALIPVKIIALFILVSCSKSSNMYSNPSPSPAPGKGGNSVTIANMAFSPSSLTVPVNTMVTWTNSDGVAHTVTSTTGLFDSGSISTSSTYSYTFTTAGTFNYYCSVHPIMTGKVIVQ